MALLGDIRTKGMSSYFATARSFCVLAALVLVGHAVGAPAFALGDTPAKRFLQRFEALCLVPVDQTAPSLVAGTVAVQHVSARAAEHGFLVNEGLFTLADRAKLTPFALYLASKGDGLTIMHDLRASAARIEEGNHFTCMFSSKNITAEDLRGALAERLGVVQFENGEMIYARNGESHRVKLEDSPAVGVTLVRHTALVEPEALGAEQ